MNQNEIFAKEPENRYIDTTCRVWLDGQGIIRLKVAEKSEPMYVPKSSALHRHLIQMFEEETK